MRRLRLFTQGYVIARPVVGRRRAIHLAWRLADVTCRTVHRRWRMNDLSGDSYLGDSY